MRSLSCSAARIRWWMSSLSALNCPHMRDRKSSKGVLVTPACLSRSVVVHPFGPLLSGIVSYLQPALVLHDYHPAERRRETFRTHEECAVNGAHVDVESELHRGRTA